MKTWLVATISAVLVGGVSAAQSSLGWRDPSPHQRQFVNVADDVRLEVLDWGGAGPPIVLLAGLGNTAHVFDDFAPALRPLGHVYGITRRSFGASGRPESGYGATELGRDVLQVLDALSLDKPVLVGHSLAGQELSAIASRDAQKVASVVYLDAGYHYAYWPKDTAPQLVVPPTGFPLQPQPAPSDLISYESYRRWSLGVMGYVVPESEIRQLRVVSETGAIGERRPRPDFLMPAIYKGWTRFTEIKAPALFVYASPHDLGPWINDATEQAPVAAFRRADADDVEQQATAVDRGVRNAKVVRLSNANHYLFITQHEEVLQLLRAFLEDLPP